MYTPTHKLHSGALWEEIACMFYNDVSLFKEKKKKMLLTEKQNIPCGTLLPNIMKFNIKDISYI
jgi:hypothetical protein